MADGRYPVGEPSWRVDRAAPARPLDVPASPPVPIPLKKRFPWTQWDRRRRDGIGSEDRAQWRADGESPERPSATTWAAGRTRPADGRDAAMIAARGKPMIELIALAQESATGMASQHEIDRAMSACKAAVDAAKSRGAEIYARFEIVLDGRTYTCVPPKPPAKPPGQ